VKNIKKIIFGTIILAIVIVCMVNIFFLKNPEFWKISVGNCFTLIVTLVITYYFTKKNQDDNNKKAILLDLIHKFEDLINDEKLSNISDETDMNYLLMKKRQISNYLGILKNNQEKFNIKDEVEFIEEKANEYMRFLGDHQDDLEYLKKSRNELMRPLELIGPKLVEAMLKLYD
jgi:hypothetical protein